MTQHFVIVGAGQAGAQAVQTLRQRGFTGRITVFGKEPHRPYQRPPLSKKYLAGALERERLYLRPVNFYRDKDVALEIERSVVDVDPASRRVALSDGRRVDYDRLLLATGARPRALAVPGAELEGIHYLRTLGDADALAENLRPGCRLLIVGAGYIGLEVAAVAKTLGADVTVIEALDRVMSRVVCSQVSAFYHDYHRAAGVDVRCNAELARFHGKESVESAETVSGERFECDLVLAGIGIEPRIELARAAGLTCDNGIVVDEHAATSDSAIFAAGDCTSHPNALIGRRVRLESVHNAIEQAKAAAGNMLGESVEYADVPWFWSDQYDLKLQIAGLSQGYDQIVVRGDMAAGRFAAFYLAGGRLIAVDAVNSPREFMTGKKLIAGRARLAPEALADRHADLTQLAAGR